MGLFVLVGTWLKFRRARWTHQFIIGRIEDGQAYVIQAQMKGVTDSMTLDELRAMGDCEVIAPPEECDRDRIVDFCELQLGDPYGLLSDLAMGIDLLAWNWIPSFRSARKQTWQCSALVNEALRYAGWYHPWLDIYEILPDESYAALTKERK